MEGVHDLPIGRAPLERRSLSSVRVRTGMMFGAADSRNSPAKRPDHRATGLAADGGAAPLDAAMRLVEVDEAVKSGRGYTLEIAAHFDAHRRLVALDGRR